jgi:hypothetical protein
LASFPPRRNEPRTNRRIGCLAGSGVLTSTFRSPRASLRPARRPANDAMAMLNHKWRRMKLEGSSPSKRVAMTSRPVTRSAAAASDRWRKALPAGSHRSGERVSGEEFVRECGDSVETPQNPALPGTCATTPPLPPPSMPWTGCRSRGHHGNLPVRESGAPPARVICRMIVGWHS